MTLLEVVGRLDELDPDHTVYARRPWSAESEVVVAAPPQDEALVPPELAALGLTYVLEISVALEFLQGWQSNLVGRPSIREQCERLIQYAISDV